MTSCPTRPLPAATLFMILFPESFDEDPERCYAVAVRMEAAHPGLRFRAVQNRFIRPENGFTLSCSEPTLIPCVGAAGEGVYAESQPARPSLETMRELEESLRIAVRGAAALD
ncbi:hypothetical protein QR78_16525 [Methylobacterium indicum]|uniref:Uncharacterized protein n=2 Tax=Methylobacterium indicum TaxID=1775910 RepID=A0ABR5HEJ1_9HYPH|nr:hypothetical protein QR78_16525 [Methylobacterium indicum]KMO24843.1 hypothetical protein QR79_10210 [Methylobacterium indicum]